MGTGGSDNEPRTVLCTAWVPRSAASLSFVACRCLPNALSQPGGCALDRSETPFNPVHEARP